jgi:hypothetical protein
MEDASGTCFSRSGEGVYVNRARLKGEGTTTTLRPKIELYGALPNDLTWSLRNSLLASVVDSIRPWR